MKLFNLQLSRKQYHQVMVVLAAALILTGFFAYNTYTEKKQYQTFLQNTYQRSFRDLISNVENINTLLEKTQVTASPQHSNELMTQVWRQSFSASENLGQLPITHSALSNTAKYLTQVGDFCYSLSRLNAANKMMDDKQLAQLGKLKDYSTSLLGQLQTLDQEVAMGKIQFGELRKKGRLILKRASENAVDVKFGAVEDKFNDYPTMVYDGPFSDNIIEGKPKQMPDKTVSLKEAEQNARKFVSGFAVGKIIETSSGKGTIETYGLELVPKDNNRDNSISMDITKKGGMVLWMINPRAVPEKKLTDQQASEKAKAFLKQHDFGPLEETFYLKNDNSTVITYVGTGKNGELIYTDQMKVKVALDNGEVIGFDSRQYITAHHDRNIAKPKLTEEQARQKVSTRLKIDRVKLTIIPLPGDKEQLCYEFKGTFGGNDYFVYINADNGNEENILRIKKVENGILAQ